MALKKENLSNIKDQYTSEDIQVLEGLQAVRLRPGMYIGSTDSTGLHHLVYEIVDNSVDEFMANYCTSVSIEILSDGTIQIEDDGRGIPVDQHKSSGMSGVETVMTTLHAGGKFGGKAYTVSGGLHGVGASVVNALSSYFKVEVYRDGNIYTQEFSKGLRTSDLNSEPQDTSLNSVKTGTRITFLPDKTIFSKIEYDFFILNQRFKEMAYLNRGMTIKFKSDWHKESVDTNDITYLFQGGIVSFVEDMNKNRNNIIPKPFYIENQIEQTIVEVALQYNDSFNENIYSFANCINTTDGGSHITGFRSALTRVINDYGRKQNLLKDSNLSGEATRDGLTAVISVKLTNPQFEGQTKAKLGNPEVRTQVETILGEAFNIYLEDNPKISKRIIEKILIAQNARDAARKARDLIIRKNSWDGSSLPGKLADCSDKNPENCELYIVEGESAGGTAKMGRDRTYQAILPIKGKILNVEKSREDKIFLHEEIKNLIIAIGGGVGEEFDIEKIRYHRIIIMTDADVDGAHIRTLLLTFFFRHMYKLIENNNLYIAQPPLYRITSGRKSLWAYSDDERDKVIGGFEGKGKINTQRYKGLGEMSAEQLWDTTMDPESRTLNLVKSNHTSMESDMFSLLMGDEVPPRREFIQTNALSVTNIDT